MRVAKIDRYDMLNNPGGDKPALTVWFSGCSRECSGCQNPELQDYTNGTMYNAQDLADLVINHCIRTNIQDIVLLGGEPLEQVGITALCKILHSNGYKLWLYTGYEIDEIIPGIIDTLYWVKCGAYIEELRTNGFPASSNQRVFKRNGNIWEPELWLDTITITTQIGL